MRTRSGIHTILVMYAVFTGSYAASVGATEGSEPKNLQPETQYVLSHYKRYKEQAVEDWTERNTAVERAGGWMRYAREPRKITPYLAPRTPTEKQP